METIGCAIPVLGKSSARRAGAGRLSLLLTGLQECLHVVLGVVHQKVTRIEKTGPMMMIGIVEVVV